MARKKQVLHGEPQPSALSLGPLIYYVTILFTKGDDIKHSKKPSIASVIRFFALLTSFLK